MTDAELREKQVQAGLTASEVELTLKKVGVALTVLVNVPFSGNSEVLHSKARKHLENFFDSEGSDNISVEWNTNQVMESTCTP